ncbi:MAG: class I SAM-dependent methyltransferase [Brachymonas sp.]|nr:class I SAM-dependent methyltransferase [Brachymonas sp.]
MNEQADLDKDLRLPLARCAWLEPHTLSSPAPWAGHIPFAAWLMALMRPRTLVELGVYSGISYLAFCQAAVQNGVPLRAWGVDTWRGDAHAGRYDGAAILRTLREQHDARYGAFSTLLQKTFDEALADIADGSIDLLHIDGLHTYEAVRHDFEGWLPKLSERAVVLFHDTAVRQGDFGVWRLWDELKQRYASLSFEHSNGLGVLLVGPQAPELLRQFAADARRWEAVRHYFRTLGERLELRAERLHQNTVLADLQEKTQAQHQWIEQQDARLRQLQQLQALDAQSIHALQQELGRRDEQLQQSNDQLRASEQAREQMQQEQRREAQAAQQRLDEATSQLRQSTQQLQAERKRANALHDQLQEMLQSRSWRATAGLRWLGRRARGWRASAAGQFVGLWWHRARSVGRYVAAGDWQALMQRIRHVNQQAAQVQRLQQFDGQQGLACGILATPHTWFVAHAIQAALARAGLAAQLVQEGEGGYSLDLYFVVCPQMFKQLPPGEKRIAFQMEQSVSSRWFTPEYLSVLENSLAVLDYARTNISNLAGYGIAYPHVFYAPIGGIADYASWGGAEPVQADEACDVLFYGDVNVPRRRRLLEAIGRRFKLRVVGNAFGAAIHRALAGAKVVVNLHYYEGALLETTRIYECLSLGKAVVSEVAVDQAEHAALEPVVRFVPLDDEAALLAALEAALAEQNSEQGRAQYAARCREVVAATQARFDFMLYRLLLARRIIDYPAFARLTQAAQPLAPRMALSLPETTARREAFEAVCPNDVAIFDGLRYTPGWAGAAMSYKYLAQTALQQGLPQLEIMEDDVEFASDYPLRRQQVQAYLAAHAGQWDAFVGVMALVHPDTRVLRVDRIDGQTYVTIDRMISMVGNIYAPTALQRIAQWDESNQDAQTNTIDRFLQMQGNMRVVITLPFLLGHREDVDSSLWGFSNERYAQLIAQAQSELEQKVAEFERAAAPAQPAA